MLRAMTISSLNMDQVTNSPIIILKETEGERTLPIWIGLLEATAIASEIEGVKFSRPMTHDLLKNFMDKTDVKVHKIEICDLKDNTYYARRKTYRKKDENIKHIIEWYRYMGLSKLSNTWSEFYPKPD